MLYYFGIDPKHIIYTTKPISPAGRVNLPLLSNIIHAKLRTLKKVAPLVQHYLGFSAWPVFGYVDTDIIPQPELLWGMGDGFVIVLVLVVQVVACDVRVMIL